eukprot:jgi/Botrbrau1/22991/Bobra.0030s0055.1
MAPKIWLLCSGGSLGIVVGVAVDLLQLKVAAAGGPRTATFRQQLRGYMTCCVRGNVQTDNDREAPGSLRDSCAAYVQYNRAMSNCDISMHMSAAPKKITSTTAILEERKEERRRRRRRRTRGREGGGGGRGGGGGGRRGGGCFLNVGCKRCSFCRLLPTSRLTPPLWADGTAMALKICLMHQPCASVMFASIDHLPGQPLTYLVRSALRCRVHCPSLRWLTRSIFL